VWSYTNDLEVAHEQFGERRPARTSPSSRPPYFWQRSAQATMVIPKVKRSVRAAAGVEEGSCCIRDFNESNSTPLPSMHL